MGGKKKLEEISGEKEHRCECSLGPQTPVLTQCIHNRKTTFLGVQFYTDQPDSSKF